MRKVAGAFVLGGTAMFAAIHAFNFLAPPIPETKIHTITVEKVVTKKSDPVVEIETKPLPNSCETVIDHLDIYLDTASKVQSNGEKINEKLANINLARVQDPESITSYQQYIADHSSSLGSALIDLMDINSLMDVRLDRCRSDIEKSDNGESVAPADGLSDAVPY